MKQLYQVSTTVMADNPVEARMLATMSDLLVTPVECDHEWWAHREVTYTEKAPAIVRERWLDIPNGQDGDHLEVVVKDPWKNGYADWKQEGDPALSDLVAVCEKCQARVEDGESVL